MMQESKENKGFGVRDLARPASKDTTHHHIEEDTPICGEWGSDLINITEVDIGLCVDCFPSTYWTNAHSHKSHPTSANMHTARGDGRMRGCCATSSSPFYLFEIIGFSSDFVLVSVVDLSVGLPVDCCSGGRESAFFGLPEHLNCVKCGECTSCGGLYPWSAMTHEGLCWGCWRSRIAQDLHTGVPGYAGQYPNTPDMCSKYCANRGQTHGPARTGAQAGQAQTGQTHRSSNRGHSDSPHNLGRQRTGEGSDTGTLTRSAASSERCNALGDARALNNRPSAEDQNPRGVPASSRSAPRSSRRMCSRSPSIHQPRSTHRRRAAGAGGRAKQGPALKAKGGLKPHPSPPPINPGSTRDP